MSQPNCEPLRPDHVDAGDDYLCMVCDVSVDSIPDGDGSYRRCMDCRLQNRTAKWRLRFQVGEISHRTDWDDRFGRIEGLREYYVSQGIGTDHRLERQVTEGGS